MDYNSIDEDDVDNLRLAALMTLKKKSYLSINTRTGMSENIFPHNTLAHSSPRASSYNSPARNNGGWFPSSNKSSSKRSSRHVNLKKSVYSNSNLISIVPSDIECDFYSDLTNSTLALNSEVEKSSNIHNSSNEVSTKFSRLEHESESEESDDSEPEINEKDESDDCDILSLGEKDKDLDDLDTLMDIIEAEIADGVNESSINKSSSLKINNDCVIKNATELNTNRNEQIALNQPKIIEDSESQLNPSKKEHESIITLETNTNSPSESSLLKSSVVLKSPMPSNIKRSISPYTKYLNRCSTTVGHSRPQHTSLPPKKLSPIKEKILSPVRCSPPKSQNPSSSPKKTQVISPNNRRQSQFIGKSISLKRKSRSPDNSYSIKKSNSPIKKLKRSRQISPTIRCADNNYHLQKTVKLKLVDKQVETRPFDLPLEQVLDVKNLSIQHTDSVDLRTELKRRRALRLNMNELDLKKKSESFYPTRLLQSAIRDAVDSSAHGVKRKEYSNKPGIRVQTEGNSNGRRVILLSENQYNYYNDEVDSYSSAKRLKGNCKKVPLHFQVTGVPNNKMEQKGLKKIIRQNINVTDIDQM
ncbi:uncharacterized protein LOC100569986 isoform X2 [Acyrthosiphon pisum]|uniref:Uncharacterized protein n=1 Tax=Acyrthosiphon pisum TaxID=7029 RepID=A0A8R2D705_ACYPI|nr:uncharacterized protein LOC100569986 isoform X2 [Acyrthosiphon pisum]|eukprot:XP_016663421.1 PREDICTED: uncharacterized protein LOC100569986 isoform X2 [Acyrthosiphon pisum]